MIKRRIKVLLVSLVVLLTLTSYYFIKETDKSNERNYEGNVVISKKDINEESDLTWENATKEELDSAQENTANEESNSEQGVVVNKVEPGEVVEYEVVDFEITWNPAEGSYKKETLPDEVEYYGQERIYGLIDNEAKADAEFVEKIVSQIELIPEDIIETFTKEGWRICITNENLENKLVNPAPELLQDDVIITGLTEISENTIYLYNVGLTLINNTAIHEFGHYTDRIYGWPSLEPEFKTVYINEKQLIKSDCVINNERELFAEAFERVILKEDTDDLEVYSYIKETLKKPILKKTS